jgi:deoxyribodipyrimidine photolyase-related protein
MSDYCSTCAFDPRKNCPITSMYWAFLDRHEPLLGDNPRLRMPLASLRRRDAARRRADREVFEATRRRLGEGLPVTADRRTLCKEEGERR